jgi:hypothetical protein
MTRAQRLASTDPVATSAQQRGCQPRAGGQAREGAMEQSSHRRKQPCRVISASCNKRHATSQSRMTTTKLASRLGSPFPCGAIGAAGTTGRKQPPAVASGQIRPAHPETQSSDAAMRTALTMSLEGILNGTGNGTARLWELTLRWDSLGFRLPFRSCGSCVVKTSTSSESWL